MIGEIRDTETAQIAVQASITGHLVVSTLHTNSSASTLTRLMDMGIESYLLADSMVGVIAQRLVRRLCPKCRQPYQASEEENACLVCRRSIHWYFINHVAVNFAAIPATKDESVSMRL